MMKKLLILFALLSMAFTAFAQSGHKQAAFHLSFVPPLSTNGRLAGEYTNTASFSLLAGLSKNEEAFSLAGLANIVKNDANGFQMAGLFNIVGHSGHGVELSGLANIHGHDYSGVQIAGLYNAVGNNGSGWMLGGLGNLSGKTYRGFQFGGLGNKAGKINGFQLGGLGNITGDLHGFQFGGVFNVAKDVKGVQFAGVVNIAESSDCPIALVNIIKNGEYSIAATYSDIGSAVLSFRSGGRITYGILGVGYNHKSDDDGFVLEGGFGAHINVNKWFRLNNEIKAGNIGELSDADTFYGNYALLPAFRVLPGVEIFGGPSINYMQTDNVDNKDMFPSHSIWKEHSDTKLKQVFFGYQVGVQFVF